VAGLIVWAEMLAAEILRYAQDDNLVLVGELVSRTNPQ
jgi:hypothetical protein